MSGLPFLKFYPTDWQADAGVRMCSYAARGLWFEMLCLMHQSEGYLRMNGRNLTPAQLARLTGGQVDEVEALLAELEEAGVFSRDPDGTPFSRRILRDMERADEARARALAQRERSASAPDRPRDHARDPAPDPAHQRARPRYALVFQNPESRFKMDDDAKAAGAPFRRAALADDDEKSLDAAMRVLVAEGDSIAIGQRRKIADAAAGPDVCNPVAFVKTSIANAVRQRHRPRAKPEPSPPREQVWIVRGSPEWEAWNHVKPRPALESKWHPGEWGTYRDSLFPPLWEARA